MRSNHEMVQMVWIVVLLTLLIVALLGTQPSWAAPFLVTDPAPTGDAVGSYQVDIDGTVYDSVPQTLPTGEVRLQMDLAPLAITPGAHSAKAKACNAAGCSAWSAVYTGVMSRPFAPSGFRLEP